MMGNHMAMVQIAILGDLLFVQLKALLLKKIGTMI